MARLRRDLSIEKNKSGGEPTYVIRDPVSGDAFEFGEEEFFLIERLKEGDPPERIAGAFHSRFGAPIGERAVAEFIDRLRLWGLCADEFDVDSSERVDPMSGELFVDDGGIEEAVGLGAGDDALVRPRQAQRWQPDRARVLVRPLRYLPIARDPRWMQWLAWVTTPLRYLALATPLLLLFAVGILAHHWALIEQEFARVWAPLNLLEHLVFGLLTVNLVSKLAAGTTCASRGGVVSSFGIQFAFGFIPRFHVELAGWDNMEHRGMLLTLASPIVAKLLLFSGGVLLWYLNRDTGTHLPTIGFLVAVVSIFALAVSANPFGVGDGYALTSAILRQSNLRGRSFRALFGRFLPAHKRLNADSAGLIALRLYAIGAIVYVVLLLSLILYVSATLLESRLQGTGVFIFLLLLVLLLAQVFRRIRQRGPRPAAAGPRETRAGAGNRAASRNRARTMSAGRGARDAPAAASKFPWGLVLFLGVLAAMFFIPYEYETTGGLELKPWERRELYSEFPAIVEEVIIDGGEWVEPGAVLATMSSYREQGDVDSLLAEIEREEARLQKLLTTPRDQEVELALKQYEAARVRERFAVAEAERLESLRAQGNVSQADFDEAMRRRDVAIQETLELKANLDLVKEGPHPQEIEAARAEIKRLRAELARGEERLKRTRLVAPIPGRLDRLDLRELEGKYLDDGDLYVSIIDDTVMKAEIEVPQPDVPMVKVGDRARLKLWAYPDRTFIGEVLAIEPVEETSEGVGVVSRVQVRLPNDEGLFRAGMTGYGKVGGRAETVALAFTHRFVRFFQVEVWSWIP